MGEQQDYIRQALDLAQYCGIAYKQANDMTKRMFNQVFFNKIYVNPETLQRPTITTGSYRPPFDIIYDANMTGKLPDYVKTTCGRKHSTNRIPSGSSADNGDTNVTNLNTNKKGPEDHNKRMVSRTPKTQKITKFNNDQNSQPQRETEKEAMLPLFHAISLNKTSMVGVKLYDLGKPSHINGLQAICK